MPWKHLAVEDCISLCRTRLSYGSTNLHRLRQGDVPFLERMRVGTAGQLCYRCSSHLQWTSTSVVNLRWTRNLNINYRKLVEEYPIKPRCARFLLQHSVTAFCCAPLKLVHSYTSQLLTKLTYLALCNNKHKRYMYETTKLRFLSVNSQ